MNNNFSEFTNLYSLSKTLRFSLIPVLFKKQEEEVKNDKDYRSLDEISRHNSIQFNQMSNTYIKFLLL